jgi:stringent starvation protein B
MSASNATHQLLMGNEEISFQARFGGKAFPGVVPIGRVMAIYARENGDGMAFDVTESEALTRLPQTRYRNRY